MSNSICDKYECSECPNRVTWLEPMHPEIANRRHGGKIPVECAMADDVEKDEKE